MDVIFRKQNVCQKALDQKNVSGFIPNLAQESPTKKNKSTKLSNPALILNCFDVFF